MVTSLNILFVCTGNVNRSKTFEKVMKKRYVDINWIKFKSTGTLHGYPDRLSKDLLEWATFVYVMDLSQEIFIIKRYPERLTSKLRLIGISDQYSCDEKESSHQDLLDLIKYWDKIEFNRLYNDWI